MDDRHNPKFAKVHIIDGDEMRDRFNRAYAARKKAGHTIPIGRGVWESLYLPEAQAPVRALSRCGPKNAKSLRLVQFHSARGRLTHVFIAAARRLRCVRAEVR